MKKFKDIEEMEAWMKPLSYEQFWQEMLALGYEPGDRNQIDAQITDGEVSQDTVLKCLKATSRLDLIEELGLDYCDELPWLKLVKDH